MKKGLTPRERGWVIRSIEPEATAEGEQPSKRLIYGATVSGPDGPYVFPSYAEAKEQAEARGLDYRSVTAWRPEAE